jgi:hypothetical protein
LLDGLFVLVTPIIHEPANRGPGVGSDFDQIEIELFREPESLVQLLDADLLSIWCNHTDLFGPNGSVHAKLCDAGTSC